MYAMPSSMKRLRRDLSPDGYEVARNLRYSLRKRLRPLPLQPDDQLCAEENASSPAMLAPLRQSSSNINNAGASRGSTETLSSAEPEYVSVDNEGDFLMGEPGTSKHADADLDAGPDVRATSTTPTTTTAQYPIPHITINQDIAIDNEGPDRHGSSHSRSQVHGPSTSAYQEQPTSVYPYTPSDRDTNPRIPSFSVPYRGVSLPFSPPLDEVNARSSAEEPPLAAKPQKRRIAMGFRSDCERCRRKEPNHYNHIISLS